jgi:hypothetical protein
MGLEHSVTFAAALMTRELLIRNAHPSFGAHDLAACFCLSAPSSRVVLRLCIPGTCRVII